MGSVNTDSTWNIAADSSLSSTASSAALTLASDKTITKSGAGLLSLASQNTSFSGTIRLTDGTLSASGSVDALGSGSAKLALDGGRLELVGGPIGSAFNRDTTVGGNATIVSRRANSGSGTTQTLGTLAIGANTLTIESGSQMTDGTAGITFGATTLAGNAAFNVNNNITGVTTRLTLGAVSGAHSVTKSGSGELFLTGANTYSGDTTVALGSLTLEDDAALTFVIGTSGVNNQLNGTGAVSLNGDFIFNLSSASQAVGDSWDIVNVGSLNETFGSSFTVIDFMDAGGGFWTKEIAGSTYYQFSEGTGVLSVVPEPGTTGMLGLGALLTLLFRRRRAG